MEMSVFRVLIIITSVCSLSAKHIYVPISKTWKDAQSYCRSHYTDLSPLTTELEEEVFKSTQSSSGWMGLYRDSSPSVWKWSGGTDAIYLNWYNEPSSDYYKYGYWHNAVQQWSVGHDSGSHNFFCLNLMVVEVKKSWEEALEHCRDQNTNLTSLLSATERLLAQEGIKKVNITEPVWVGLRYLGDAWLWVNDDPLVYEVWTKGTDQDHRCPLWKRCGALTQEGLWENLDCQDKLNFICA